MDVLNLSLPLFGLIFIGYLAARLRPLPDSALDWMSFFIIYVALPALFFQLIRQAPIKELINMRFVLATTGATATVFVFALFAGRYVFNRNKPIAIMQAVAASYSNIGYMGPAITLSVLGQAALIPTAIIFCFDNAFLFTVVPLLMSLSTRTSTSKIKVLIQALKQVITHPFILATIAGIVCVAIQIKIPVAINSLLDMLSNTAAPAALFTMGVVIAKRPATVNGFEVPALLATKLIVHPLCIYLFLSIAGDFEQSWVYTAVLMASLPPALNVYIMASDYNTYKHEASSIVLMGTILATLSVTYIIYLIKENVF